MTPEKRTKYLCSALGWSGGTVHQLAEVAGCSVQELLYVEFPTSYSFDFAIGFFWDTNSLKWQQENIIPKMKGNLFYWLGVARKMEILDINCNQGAS